MSEDTKYIKHFSEDGFWSKMKKYAVDAGVKVVYSGLILYYALQHPKTKAKDKLIIMAALGYLIFPIDAIPDLVVGVGYLDDFGALVLAASRVVTRIDDSVKEKAKAKLVDLFGESVLQGKEIKEVEEQLQQEDDPTLIK